MIESTHIANIQSMLEQIRRYEIQAKACLLYTSPSPRD